MNGNSGFLLVDKPSGPTSHDIVNIARRNLGIKKIGHTGTLDPFASGLLILLIGKEATKRQTEFLKLDKQYLATALWGYTSDTYDITGEIKQVKVNDNTIEPLNHETIEAAMQQLRGSIIQTVPAYSAVKVHGRKLYELARTQHPILPDTHHLPQRQVIIHKFEITNQRPPANHWQEKFINSQFNNQLPITNYRLHNFIISCSSGTYIRSLIHDLGQTLGCGALTAALHRTSIGSYSVDRAIPPEQIDTSRILPLPS